MPTPKRRPGAYRPVAERKIGRKLTPSEVVHHIDEDITNNTAANLGVLPRGQHTSLHGRKRPLSKLRDALRMTQEGRKLFGWALLAGAALSASCTLPNAPDGLSTQCAAYNTGVVQIRNLTSQPLTVNYKAIYLQQTLAPGNSLLEPLTMSVAIQPFTFWTASGELYGSAGITPIQCETTVYNIR